jgi:hypothetical protein
MGLGWMLLTVAVALLSCSDNQIASGGNGGGMETTNGVSASVRFQNGTPAANAIVRLRRSDYVANLPSLSKTAMYGADAKTDSQGRFTFAGLDSGDYTIEVTDNISNALLLTCSLTHGDTADLGVNILRPFAILHGTLDSASLAAGRLFVQVRGLERFTESDAFGVFSFTDLPASALGLRISAPNSSAYPAKTIYGIPVVSADTAHVLMMLPAPWQSTGINETPLGSVAIVNNTFVVSGGGPDIYGYSDGFHFVYQPWYGDISVIARVRSLDTTHENAQAGVMIRENLTASAANAVEEIEPGGWSFFQWRPAPGDTSPYLAQGPAFSFPHWLRLERRGDTLSGSHSADGINWIQQYSAIVIMPADVYIGLAVTSHRLDKTCTAEFDSVRISP